MSVILLTHTSGFALVYTATTTGSWGSANTWGGVTPPYNLATDQVVIPGGITVTLDNNVILNGLLAQLTVQGTLASDSNTTVTNTAGLITGAGTIDIGNVVFNTGGTTTFTGSLNAYTITNSATVLSASGNIMVKRHLNLLAGQFSIQPTASFTVGNNATIHVAGGAFVSTGTLNLTAPYHVTYTMATALAGQELSGTGLRNLTLDVPVANTVTLSDTLVVAGTFTLTEGTLALGLFDLTVLGEIATGGNGRISSTTSNVTINRAGGTAGALRFTSGSTVNNLNIAVSIGNTQLEDTLRVNGNFNLVSGTLRLFSADLTIAGTIADSGNGMLSSTAASNLTIASTATPGGELRFATASNTVNNLTVSVGGNGFVKIGSDLNVQGRMIFTNGKLDIQDHTLSILGTDTITGASTTSYVVTGDNGSVMQNLTPSTNVWARYPVGTVAQYFPARVRLNSGSGAGMVGVGVIPDVRANGTTGTDMTITSRLVNATWLATTTIASNLDMELMVSWPATAEVNGFDRTVSFVSHNANGNWDGLGAQADAATVSMDGATLFSRTRSNINSLSPFAVFDTTVTVISGINDAFANAGISLYPNPFTDNIFVTTAASETTPLNMDVVTINGQMIASYRLTGTVNNVSLAQLPTGNYFIKLYNNNFNATKLVSKF
ncbi:MAG TPA: T9SS type A sorting domain-containing protein [Chitinophagales bacterium]|nr:T9SS type A sorting domain-containing protein [Chitinophagales bacterium]